MGLETSPYQEQVPRKKNIWLFLGTLVGFGLAFAAIEYFVLAPYLGDGIEFGTDFSNVHHSHSIPGPIQFAIEHPWLGPALLAFLISSYIVHDDSKSE